MQICKCIKIFTSIFSNFNIKQVHMYQKTRSLNSLSKIILQEEEEEAKSILVGCISTIELEIFYLYIFLKKQWKKLIMCS